MVTLNGCHAGAWRFVHLSGIFGVEYLFTFKNMWVGLNLESADIPFYKPLNPKCFFQFKIIINVLVSPFWFIWITMLWVYDNTFLIISARGSTLDVRIWRLLTSDSDVKSRSPHWKGYHAVGFNHRFLAIRSSYHRRYYVVGYHPTCTPKSPPPPQPPPPLRHTHTHTGTHTSYSEKLPPYVHPHTSYSRELCLNRGMPKTWKK